VSELPEVGDRVELLRTTDPYTRLKPGDVGTVTRISKHPSSYDVVEITWDTGSALMLLQGVDEWRVLPKLKAVKP
jgi:archaellum component FlaG (FlaF/FlaG flagellin family)